MYVAARSQSGISDNAHQPPCRSAITPPMRRSSIRKIRQWPWLNVSSPDCFPSVPGIVVGWLPLET